MSFQVESALLAKYDQPGPRYTSYPTAPAWRDDFDTQVYERRLAAAARRVGEPLSLYVHIPFCESLCWYCGCSVVITQQRDKGSEYVGQVLAEAELLRRHLPSDRPVAQHHWGGGTPTFLTPAEIRRLANGLTDLFPLAPNAEVAIEVDPRVTTVDQLEALRECGFNRISMGVQDFEPEVQRAIHRIQSFEQTAALVEAARRLGFWSVNLDIVYGLPHQREATFATTIQRVLELSPDRLACYGYAHVPWLKKHQAVIPEDALPRGEAKLALYLIALDRLGNAGYEAIGMDHFAKRTDSMVTALREGSLHRNFMGYSTHPAEDMLALGMTSISEIDGTFAQNHRELQPWRDAVAARRLPICRGLERSADDSLRRRVILDLMCRLRVNFADYGGEAAFRQHFAGALEALQPMAADGLVSIGPDGLLVSEVGRLFVRNLCMPFDAYLKQQREGDRPVFSRTV